MTLPAKHGGDHRRGGEDPIPYTVYHIKVSNDIDDLVAGDGAFFFSIPRDLHDFLIFDVEATVSTASGSGIVQVQVRNVTNSNVDVLSTRVQVDAGETHSDDASTQPVVNQSNNVVSFKDVIAIDVDAAGSGAKGLCVVIYFQL